MSATGSTLIVGRMAYEGAVKTFGALPFARIILTFQCPGLRKHPGVGRNDLLLTERVGYRFPWSTEPFGCHLPAPALRPG